MVKSQIQIAYSNKIFLLNADQAAFFLNPPSISQIFFFFLIFVLFFFQEKIA